MQCTQNRKDRCVFALKCKAKHTEGFFYCWNVYREILLATTTCHCKNDVKDILQRLKSVKQGVQKIVYLKILLQINSLAIITVEVRLTEAARLSVFHRKLLLGQFSHENWIPLYALGKNCRQMYEYNIQIAAEFEEQDKAASVFISSANMFQISSANNSVMAVEAERRLHSCPAEMHVCSWFHLSSNKTFFNGSSVTHLVAYHKELQYTLQYKLCGTVKCSLT